MGNPLQISSGVLLLPLYCAVAWALPQTTDPFQDESDQCLISVNPDVLKSLSESLRTDLKCDDLWNNLLLRFHHTRENLTECWERANTDATPEPSGSFCQLLLDDAQRQLEQEHRKYSADVEEKLHTAQQEARKHLDEKVTLQNHMDSLLADRNELYLELLLAYIAIGDTKQAIKYYELYPDKQPVEKLHEQIVRSVYRVAKYQDQRLINLAHFVHQISGTDTKHSLYRLMKVEILKRPSQRDSYVAAVVALNMRTDDAVHKKDPQLYAETMGPIEKRWKDQIYNGNFNEVADFARRQQTYFNQMQTTLATVDPSKWTKLNFERFVAYPNMLPQPTHRVEAFRQILKQIRERNPNNSHKHLVQTAKQFNICEDFLKKTKADQSVMRSFDELRKKFKEFARKDYGEYLREAKG